TISSPPSDLHSFPTRRSSDLKSPLPGKSWSRWTSLALCHRDGSGRRARCRCSRAAACRCQCPCRPPRETTAASAAGTGRRWRQASSRASGFRVSVVPRLWLQEKEKLYRRDILREQQLAQNFASPEQEMSDPPGREWRHHQRIREGTAVRDSIFA